MKSGVWKLIQFAYSAVLRPLLVKAIDNPDSEWDEWVLKVIDRLFDYNEG